MFIQRRKEHVSSVDIGIFFDSSLSAEMQSPQEKLKRNENNKNSIINNPMAKYCWTVPFFKWSHSRIAYTKT